LEQLRSQPGRQVDKGNNGQDRFSVHLFRKHLAINGDHLPDQPECCKSHHSAPLTRQAIEKVPIFKHLAETSDIWKGVFTVSAGIAPATIAAIFGYVLPFIMRFLSHWSGAMSKGDLDKDVVRQLFFFLVVSPLLAATADESFRISWSSLSWVSCTRLS
jgi:hypothetical protein